MDIQSSSGLSTGVVWPAASLNLNSTPPCSSFSAPLNLGAAAALMAAVPSAVSVQRNRVASVGSFLRRRFSFQAEREARLQAQQLVLQQHGLQRADVVCCSNRGRHSVVCRHWWRGACMRGAACDFLHRALYKRMPKCRFDGACADALRGCCPYKHEQQSEGLDQLLASTNPDPAAAESHAMEGSSFWGGGASLSDGGNYFHTHQPQPQQQECLSYYFGFCRLGPRCKKKHSLLPRSQLPEVAPAWFLESVVANYKEVFPESVDPVTQEALDRVAANLRAVLNKARAEHQQLAQQQQLQQIQQLQHQQQTRSTGGGPASSASSASASAVPNSEGAMKSTSKDVIVPLLTNAWGVPATPASTKRFFIIKSSRMANIYLSVHCGVWATSRGNTKRLTEAFGSCDHVVLLFSANESGGFQGYARMMTFPTQGLLPGVWGPVQVRLGGNFRVQWLKQCRIDFEDFGRVTNPWNEDLPLKKSRDGTELPPHLGAMLCSKMHQRPSESLLEGTAVEGLGAPIDHHTFFRQLKAAGTLEDQDASSLQHQQQPQQQQPQHQQQLSGDFHQWRRMQ